MSIYPSAYLSFDLPICQLFKRVCSFQISVREASFHAHRAVFRHFRPETATSRPMRPPRVGARVSRQPKAVFGGDRGPLQANRRRRDQNRQVVPTKKPIPPSSTSHEIQRVMLEVHLLPLRLPLRLLRARRRALGIGHATVVGRIPAPSAQRRRLCLLYGSDGILLVSRPLAFLRRPKEGLDADVHSSFGHHFAHVVLLVQQHGSRW